MVDSLAPVILNNVFYESGSAELLQRSYFELENLFNLLKEHPDMKMQIRGHTDSVGTDQDNQVLSEARAKAIYDYLLAKEISAERISYVGLGESMPIADNDTEKGRQKNRRTEFVIIKNGKKKN